MNLQETHERQSAHAIGDQEKSNGLPVGWTQHTHLLVTHGLLVSSPSTKLVRCRLLLAST